MANKIPWYSRVFFRRRYLASKQILRDLAREVVDEKDELVGLSSVFLQVQLFENDGLLHRIFLSLAEKSAGEVKQLFRKEVGRQLHFLISVHKDTLVVLGQHGRESTAKGSIGHDQLNVKTMSRSKWVQHVATTMNRAAILEMQICEKGRRDPLRCSGFVLRVLVPCLLWLGKNCIV